MVRLATLLDFKQPVGCPEARALELLDQKLASGAFGQVKNSNYPDPEGSVSFWSNVAVKIKKVSRNMFPAFMYMFLNPCPSPSSLFTCQPTATSQVSPNLNTLGGRKKEMMQIYEFTLAQRMSRKFHS